MKWTKIIMLLASLSTSYAGAEVTTTMDDTDLTAGETSAVTFIFTSSNGNGVTGTLTMFPDSPGETFTYNAQIMDGDDRLPFSIDYSTTGGGVEQGGLARILSDNANCLSQFASYTLELRLLFCDVLQGVMPIDVSTTSAQRHLDSGNFPPIGTSATYNGPELHFSSTSAGDSITFNGTTTLGDWVADSAPAQPSNVVTIALNKISATINGSGSAAPTVDDYKDAGVVSIDQEELTRILSILNYALSHQTATTDVDETSEIEALIATVMSGQDDDSDGLPNLVEGDADTDGDGNSDDNDNDADNDGIADWLEHGLLMVDSDSDGIIDALDADVDGDGAVESGKLDANFDGVDDHIDSLTELIINDASMDRDSDGQVNYLDLDSDNDGVLDLLEAGLRDVDNNGLLDAGATLIVDETNLPDTNADNTPNVFELISDGTSRDLIVHGLPESFDVNEDGKLDSTIEMDHDGIVDIIDGAVGAFGSFKDFDGDGLANHIDTDDDGDGIPDIIENPRQGDFTGLDADADGIDDGVDHDVNGTLVGVDTDANGVQDDKEIPDADHDGVPDHLDNDSDNDGVTDGKDISVNTGPDFESSNSGIATGAMNPLAVFALFGLLFARLCSRKRLVVVALLMSMPQAQAGPWIVGLGIGQASFDPELAEGLTLTEDSDTAMQVSLAYVIDESWLAEWRYVDLGEAEINSAATVGQKVMSMNLQHTLARQPLEKISLYVLAGVAVIELEGSGGLNVKDKNSADFSLGFGARYHFSDLFMRAELASYNANNRAFMLGLDYRF